MGCSKTPLDDNEEDIDYYDERYDFYNFRSKRMIKNPTHPSKINSDKFNDKIETRNRNKEEEKDNDNEKNYVKKGGKNQENQKYYNSIKNKNKINTNSNEKNILNKMGDLNVKSNENKKYNKKKLNDNTYKIFIDNETNILQIKNTNIERYNMKNNNAYKNYYIKEDFSNNKDMFSFENLISEKGNAISNYEKNIEEEKLLEKLKEEKNNNLKLSRINGITIVENFKEYFPENITKQEVQNLVFEALSDSIVDDKLLYIPGQTVTNEQTIELSNYIYNIIKNKNVKSQNCLENLNIKIDLVPLNKKLIKDKMFKGKEPSNRELENVYKSYVGDSNNNLKVLTIEFQ